MKKGKINLPNFIIITSISIFIIFFISFLVFVSEIQKETPVINTFILFLGFTIIIISLYLSLNISGSNQKFKIKFLSENLMKVIILALMIVSFLLIPPITFSSTIISWQEVKFLNLIRALIFIFGCAFLPGSCLFNIIFPNNTIHKRVGVETFLIKLTFYPLLSFISLGLIVVIFDQIGFTKDLITISLICFVIALFLFDLIFQNLKEKYAIKTFISLTISKYTIIILLISLGVVTFSLGIILGTKYLIPGDSWALIAHANYIGLPEESLNASRVASWNYPLFWAYPTFAISVLSGIPFININVLLTPFLYLIVLTIYLFMKAILNQYKEIYALLCTFFTITFTGLLSYNNIADFNKKGMISNLVFDGLINFRYKSVAMMLFFAGLTLFFITLSDNNEQKNVMQPHSEIYKFLGLSALFLVIGFITYSFPLLFGLIIIIAYCILKKSKVKYIHLKKCFYFLLFIFLIFVILDICMNFFLSGIAIGGFSYFFYFNILLTLLNEFPIYFITYSAFIISILFILALYLIYRKFYKNQKRFLRFKLKVNSKLEILLFLSFIIIFTIFLIIYIASIINKALFLNINNNFIFFYLNNYFFPRIGIIGIIGLFLSYFCYKSNKNFFLILISLISLIFFISSLLFLKVFLSYFPNIPTLTQVLADLSKSEYNELRYWFTRTWVYVIPLISIFFTIGLFEFTKKIKNLSKFNKKTNLAKISKNVLISIFICFSLSNLIVAGIYWQNLEYNVKDDEAQTIGWITNNIPDGSSIIIDAGFGEDLERTLNYKIYKLSYTVETAYNEYFNGNKDWWFISYSYDPNCNLSILDEFKGHQDVLKLEDYNSNGHVEINFNFNFPQEYGTLEYFIYSTNSSNTFWGALTERSIDGLHIWNGSFSYYNGIEYIQLQPCKDDTWYHIKLDFECTNGSYKELDQYEWKATINGTEYDHLKMFRENTHMDSLDFNTAVKDSGWQIYLDVFNFSWYPDFHVESFIFNTTYMDEYLGKNNIDYYIHTLQDSWYKRNVETDYLNINDLIKNYFSCKKFEYGDFLVYSREP